MEICNPHSFSSNDRGIVSDSKYRFHFGYLSSCIKHHAFESWIVADQAYISHIWAFTQIEQNFGRDISDISNVLIRSILRGCQGSCKSAAAGDAASKYSRACQRSRHAGKTCSKLKSNLYSTRITQSKSLVLTYHERIYASETFWLEMSIIG